MTNNLHLGQCHYCHNLAESSPPQVDVSLQMWWINIDLGKEEWIARAFQYAKREDLCQRVFSVFKENPPSNSLNRYSSLVIVNAGISLQICTASLLL